MATDTNQIEAAYETSFLPEAKDRPRVDREAGIVFGAKACGLHSPTNGRIWPLDVLTAHAAAYEGAPCYINHDARNPAPKPGSRPNRPLGERWGTWSNVRPGPDGLYGDVRYNKGHRDTEANLGWIESNTPGVGFSHNVDYKHERTGHAGEIKKVTAITRVYSVDLVSNPGTTRSAYEQADSEPTDDAATEAAPLENESMTLDLSKLTADDLRKARPDLAKALGDDAATEAANQAAAAELAALRSKVAQMEADRAAADRQAAALEWATSDLGLPADSDAALETAAWLAGLGDETAQAGARTVLKATAEAIAAGQEARTADETDDAWGEDAPAAGNARAGQEAARHTAGRSIESTPDGRLPAQRRAAAKDTDTTLFQGKPVERWRKNASGLLR